MGILFPAEITILALPQDISGKICLRSVFYIEKLALNSGNEAMLKLKPLP